MSKQTYKALGPIGKPGAPDYKEGDTLELDEKQAERLLRAKAVAGPIGPAQAPAGGQEFDPANVTDEELEKLRRDDLEKVAAHEGVEGIGDKNMDVLKAEILEIRAAAQAPAGGQE